MQRSASVMKGRVRTNRLGLVIMLLALLSPQLAAGQEDKPPFLLLEPTEYTDVLDAFESVDDPFDFSVRLGFVRSQEDAVIERERNAAGAFTVDTLAIADYQSVRSALVLDAEIGIYRDLMLFWRLPLVFSDTRELTIPEAAQCSSAECRHRAREVQQVLSDTRPTSTELEPLFELDGTTASRTRSGVPAVDVGVAYGILNQYRSPGLPTWIVLAETRFSIGAPMDACIDGVSGCEAGASRGTTRLELGTRFSYRYRFVEPYLGLDHAFEWSSGAVTAFEPGGDGPHAIDTGLPSVTGLTVGGSVVPWEHRGRFQQLAIDVRGRAEYVSDGRDYTPLFDVLGTSTNPYLDTPQPRDNGRPIAFNGLTQVQSHARLSFDLGLLLQAARYVKFRVGLTLAHATRHLLTGARPCTEATRGEGEASGSCGERVPNALYRAVIDQPGQRFVISSQLAYSVSATAAAQF